VHLVRVAVRTLHERVLVALIVLDDRHRRHDTDSWASMCPISRDWLAARGVAFAARLTAACDPD
jgi:hypothetical protein